MKTLLLPLASALLATGLSVYGCHLFGMPRHDLVIAALVAGSIAVSAAVGAVLLSKRRQARI